MSACPKCGHDPSAPVAQSWTFHVDRLIDSGNRHVFNVGASRFTYGRDRDAWQWEFRAVRLLQRIPVATRRRRVTLTRNFGGRQREFDRDNLATGCKLVVDAMVRERLLVDDSSAHAEINYTQQRVAPIGLTVLLEEFADAG